MFGKRITIFRVFGFAVRVDASWIVIAVLVSWTLAGYFGQEHPDLGAAAHWTMALCGMAGLFLSVVVHELSHSLTARRFGVRMTGITLFLFGGVAEMANEPPNARAEFWIAIVGPITSVLLAALFYAAALVGASAGWGQPVIEVLRYLALINFLLACFNLLPGFPLDGGRVLRAILWARRGSLRAATRIAAQVGGIFGLVLIGVGVLNAFTGNLIGGVWYLMLGLFLRAAAQNAYAQVLLRRTLQGETVRRFMRENPVAIAPENDVREIVEDYFYKHLHKIYPVVGAEGNLLGCITTRRIREIPRDQWVTTRATDVLEPCTTGNTIGPDADASEALGRMTRSGESRLLVVDQGRLVGVLVLKDLLRLFALKMDIESPGAGVPAR